MGEHFKPDNVVRGQFGRRRPAAPRSTALARSEHRGTAWLSPEDYRRLSPEAKLALAARRQLQRHGRRNQATPARFRKGHYARQRWAWFAAVCGLFAVGGFDWLAGGESAGAPRLAGAAAASAPVTTSFGFCYTGGGSNCVVDGDTFYLDGQKIRIADIDAPETHDYGCSSELERGDRATRRLQGLLNSGAVRMASIDRDTDAYGRKLRIVEVNGTGVGETLVDEGLARWYSGGRRSWC